jgi:NADPH:quinone reductase-like Zn-dependent oxidoreductase
MRAVVITKHGGPGALQVQERPDPSLSPGEVRIDVAAAGINFADVMARLGFYPDAPKPPCVVGYEVAGTILELGEGASSPDRPLSHGQRVVAGTEFGGYASQVVTPADGVIPLPDQLTFEQGAAIPVNYGTAWMGLAGFGSLLPGERVLIHAAAGGVGIAATQVAKRQGAEVYGTASPGKHERICELGVDHPLDYTTSGWERGLPPFDLIMDAIGGKSLRRSYEMLGGGGRLIAFGASAVVSGERRNPIAALGTALRMPRFNLIKQMSASKAVIGLNMYTLSQDERRRAQVGVALRELLHDGTIQPVVAGTFSFEEAGAAQNMITERRNVGKVVLVP